ncbi:ABC transporter transmembrane domain-containing protein [Aquimarina litoralis]|uniref:ABC transporter transmembrane domain-containing protein n=1 Tax=Aquimarina litoralis TaxID=584605 RepID=UPI001C5962CF|nr:ABC transporter ATP-binding protein [Aquimarina litoralis]MBW1299054.1 ATP-binding cassette domain-containing protein [Aquimarina litoralis]
MSPNKWNIINSFARRHITLLIFTFFTGFYYNILTIMIPISIGKFYELSFGFSSHRLAAFKFIPFMDAPDFGSFLIFFFSLVILRLIFEYLNRYGISLIGESFSKQLREKLFANQLQITMEVYNNKGTGKYLLRYSGDLKSIQNYIKNGVIRFLQDVFLLSIAIIVIGCFDVYLALIITVCILISSVILWMLNKMLYKVSLARRNSRSGMLSFVNTRLRGILTLKAFNKYQPEEKRYRKRSNTLYDIGKSYAKIISIIQAIIPAITYSMLGIIMLYIFISSKKNSMPIEGSSLLILILLIISTLPVLRRSLRVSIVWKLGNISFSKLINIFCLPKENQLQFENLMLNLEKIVFSDVNYCYPNTSKPVFKKINLTIVPKSTTLLQGVSGTGKSTFIRLLAKFMSPSNGSIRFGSVCSSLLSEKTIRKNIAIVSKDFPLYGRNVYEALVYNRKESTRKNAKLLLEHLQQFEKNQNQLQLDSKIGDLGANLTSGQRKILMYCRALLTKKPILILEEPLKELNIKTQNLLLQMLKNMSNQQTIILLDDHPVEGFHIDAVHYL